MNQSIEDASRSEFEAWYEANAMPLESNWFYREKDGGYKLNFVENTWEGWQAARQSSQSEPVGLTYVLEEVNYYKNKTGNHRLMGVANSLVEAMAIFDKQRGTDEDYIRSAWAKEGKTTIKKVDYDGAFITHKITEFLAAPQQAIPSGYAIVPIEPTEAMKEKGWEAFRDSNKPAPYNMLTDAYKAMLSASPTAPDATQSQAVRDALEVAAKICEGVKPIMAGNYFTGLREQSDKCANAIRKLITDTQANMQPEDYMCPNCITPWKCNGPHLPFLAPINAQAKKGE
jgi:hypothetical protein